MAYPQRIEPTFLQSRVLYFAAMPSRVRDALLIQNLMTLQIQYVTLKRHLPAMLRCKCNSTMWPSVTSKFRSLIKRFLFTFLWGSRWERVSRQKLCNDIDYEGAKIVDMDDYIILLLV